MTTRLDRDHQPVVRFPAGLAELMRPEVPSLTDEIIRDIRAAIPEYARPMDGPYGQALRIGVPLMLNSFIGLVADPQAASDEIAAVCRRLGELEAIEGRPLDRVQAAYRVGTRAAWHRVMDVGKKARLSSSVMSQLADAVLDYLDELATYTRDGYLAEQARSAGIRRQLRHTLLAMILQSPPPPQRALAELAAQIGWAVPQLVTMVAVQSDPESCAPEPDGIVLADFEDPRPYMLVPGEMTDEQLADVLPPAGNCTAAIGPTMPLTSACDSLRWARRALRLAQQGIIKGQVIRCDQHLIELWLLADMPLAERMMQRELGALAHPTPASQRQLVETLEALMDAGGVATEAAARLDVHPQTVRYRIRKLEQLLGSRFTDPRTRFGLELAVRTRQLCQRRSEPGHRQAS
ncbi:MAG: helix-turn-helix domain-containing protein [Actinobacteria bacterium]|nr:helix-turn-helix domain-containing protein [Actinomycetota bacterium]